MRAVTRNTSSGHFFRPATTLQHSREEPVGSRTDRSSVKESHRVSLALETSLHRPLDAAIPLPKRVSAPVTEVGSSGLTKLLISRENELGLRGSPRGGPSEGRVGNQRDQRESSDKCLHDTSPCLDHRPSMVHQQGAVMRLQRLDRATQCLFLSSRDSGWNAVNTIRGAR
jgi:hypothetical protein